MRGREVTGVGSRGFSVYQCRSNEGFWSFKLDAAVVL